MKTAHTDRALKLKWPEAFAILLAACIQVPWLISFSTTRRGFNVSFSPSGAVVGMEARGDGLL
ncbi:hypothetical protein BV20DRAFT_210336 [Pilatotrama ljubarskyi]|nr:hypothetical protein BV20DRAFT_210336 [Pilatotrama ljubarskyi]